MNRPFTTGDTLWADADARAELHLNNAVLRVGPQSSLGFLNLDDHFAQIRFTTGRVVSCVCGTWAKTTVSKWIRPTPPSPSCARASIASLPTRMPRLPWAVVRHGEAEVTGGGQAFTLRAGNSAQLSGTDQLAFDVGSVPPSDGFEGWAEDRDNREMRSPSARYLPPGVIGYEELDTYGNWRDTPGYGPVWYPTVASGWAPYHDGHWAWVDSVGLDLGRRRSLGLRSLPLRPLGLCQRRLGLGPWADGYRGRQTGGD